MPRKPLIYTHENPYHILARSNNKEWFYLPKSEVWFIFKEALNEASKRFGFQVYLFVLMDNHYHMIAQCSERSNLGEVMGWLQKTVSKNINHRAKKINHVFGGVYKACLLKHPDHFAAAYKYIALNPVAADISTDVFSYPFLSLNTGEIRIAEKNEWFASIPLDEGVFKRWVNDHFDPDERFRIRTALTKTVFSETQGAVKKRRLEFPIIR